MMESVFKCGNCGEVLSATALMENGGCRIVFHIQEHTCFGGDQNHYIGNAWYGPYGSLVCDVHIDGKTNLLSDSKSTYGADYLVAESMTIKAAEALAESMGLKWGGRIDERMENL